MNTEPLSPPEEYRLEMARAMRLQYIEFFGRFYSGGSRPFKPFKFETNYVEIE